VHAWKTPESRIAKQQIAATSIPAVGSRSTRSTSSLGMTNVRDRLASCVPSPSSPDYDPAYTAPSAVALVRSSATTLRGRIPTCTNKKSASRFQAGRFPEAGRCNLAAVLRPPEVPNVLSKERPSVSIVTNRELTGATTDSWLITTNQEELNPLRKLPQ